jgi:peptidoglycan pentaglycine glycine transferase (the first glycine)
MVRACGTRSLEKDLTSTEWDTELARLGGHPWQSALWGDAKREVDGIADHRWLLRHDGAVAAMARFEERRIPGLGKVAWMPRGPTLAHTPAGGVEFEPEFLARLKQEGFVLAVTNPWRRIPESEGSDKSHEESPRTIWIDLALGKEQLWKNLHQEWRRGVGKARREGVVVETTRDVVLIEKYFELCSLISQMKKFELRTSTALIKLLTETGNADAEAHLFVARCADKIAAGAFVFRCGRSIHYFGGASDRAYSRKHPGEALHWAIVEWGLAHGCKCYDLEGIDPKDNPGTYAFKKKMGGEEILLADRRVHAIDVRGRFLAPLVKRVLHSRLSTPLPALLRALKSGTERAGLKGASGP